MSFSLGTFALLTELLFIWGEPLPEHETFLVVPNQLRLERLSSRA